MVQCAASSLPPKAGVIAMESLVGGVPIMILHPFSLVHYKFTDVGACSGEQGQVSLRAHRPKVDPFVVVAHRRSTHDNFVSGSDTYEKISASKARRFSISLYVGV